jgi:hypothetical protein
MNWFVAQALDAPDQARLRMLDCSGARTVILCFPDRTRLISYNDMGHLPHRCAAPSTHWKRASDTPGVTTDHQYRARRSGNGTTPPRRLRVARLVGGLLSPPPILVVLALSVAWDSSPTPATAVLWGTIAAVFASLLPSA